MVVIRKKIASSINHVAFTNIISIVINSQQQWQLQFRLRFAVQLNVNQRSLILVELVAQSFSLSAR